MSVAWSSSLCLVAQSRNGLPHSSHRFTLLQRISNRRRRRGLRRRPILFDFLALELLHRRAIDQTNSSRLRADLDDFEIIFLARFERSRALQRTRGRAVTAHSLVAPAPVFDFCVVAKRFNIFAQFHERAERGDA